MEVYSPPHGFLLLEAKMEESSEQPQDMKTLLSEAAAKPTVGPSDRVPGKFQIVYSDGSVHPYAFRTEAEAQIEADK